MYTVRDAYPKLREMTFFPLLLLFPTSSKTHVPHCYPLPMVLQLNIGAIMSNASCCILFHLDFYIPPPFRFFPVDHLLLRFRRFKKDSVTADPACTHEACAYITCKKICNQTFIDANPSSPVVAPAECSAYANDQGRNYEYRCFPSVPILPDEHWQGGHGPNSMGAHKPPTTSATPLIVSFLRCTCFLP